MKLALIAYGTRGDVQPFLSLAWTLQQRGHTVRLLAPRNMTTWIQRSGLPSAEIPMDAQALLASEPAQKMLAKGDILSFFRWLSKAEDDYRAGMRQAIIDATSDVDAIISHPLTEDRAASVGAARKIPVMPLYPYPVPATSGYPSIFITTRNLGIFNRLTHKIMLDILWRSSRQDVAIMRKQLGVANAPDSFAREAQRLGVPVLLTYSELLSPRPADFGTNNVITGDFVMPDALRKRLGEDCLPDGLVDWLDAGEPPVFLGFGSMPVLDTEWMLTLIRGALKDVGMRAVIGAGWSNLPEGSDEQLYRVGVVNYEALFQRCVAAVHHGGAGTFHASMRSGLPTLICSVFADNPYWGAQFKKLGIGDTLPFKSLTRERLADGLRRVLSEPVRTAARRMGRQMHREDALGTAIQVVEQHLPNAPFPR